MADLIKINIQIANRSYPLTIKRVEEENLRIAGNKINEMINSFQAEYSISDKQDVLAMCALQFVSQLVNLESKSTEMEKKTNEQLKILLNLFENK